MERYRVAIIGGGCSGLFLASLLNKEKLDVFIYEKNNKLGKKILASGNGKCNFTNVKQLENKYNNQFANEVIKRFTVDTTLSFFKKYGLVFKSDELGRCYPVSENANSVLDCLKSNLLGCHIKLESVVSKIVKKGKKYSVTINNKEELFDYVVCSSGSAASNLGSYKAYDYLKDLNVKIVELKPSLTPVLIEENIKKLEGIRVKGKVSLIDSKNIVVYEENGEILFKKDALSGIAIFNISSYINRKKDNYKIQLDLSAGMSEKELINYFKNKKEKELFKGFLDDKIGEYIIENIKDKKIENIAQVIKHLNFKVKGMYEIKDAQVCAGGVSLEEINENLELCKYPNVYVAGELLDIDGVSGGYNMQFAWSSAGIIYEDIERKIGGINGEK